MKNNKLSKTNIIIYCVGIIPIVWLGLLTAPCFSGGLASILNDLPTAFSHPFRISFCEDSLKTVLIFIGAYAIGIGVYLSTARNYRHREEHGSAKWGVSSRVNSPW